MWKNPSILPVREPTPNPSTGTSTNSSPADSTGRGEWHAAFSKAKAFVNKLTMNEKIFMVTGVTGPCVGNIPEIPRLGFKGLCLQDGPLAIKQVSFSSNFPAGVAAAATWDKEMIRQRGVELGEEFFAKGAHVMLG